jgi:ubiquinone biosynthesis protein UbiJ
LVLLANHVLSAEPVAMQKLQPHAGQSIELRLSVPNDTPLNRWLPKPGPVRLLITPAGLLEWHPSTSGHKMPAALHVTVTLPTPMGAWQMVRRSSRLDVHIEGDVRLAEAASWLVQHLRWDIEHDLAKWLGTPLTMGLGAAQGHIRQTFSRWAHGLSPTSADRPR